MFRTSSPNQRTLWGALVLVFSCLSFFGFGGFIIGAILGIIGGIMALTWKTHRRHSLGSATVTEFGKGQRQMPTGDEREGRLDKLKVLLILLLAAAFGLALSLYLLALTFAPTSSPLQEFLQILAQGFPAGLPLVIPSRPFYSCSRSSRAWSESSTSSSCLR